jgi:hypothetical protein
MMRSRHHQGLPAAQQPADPARLAAARTFPEFYALYLAEHRHPLNRKLHFTGSTLALICLFFLVFTGNPWWLFAAVVCGYAFAWAGHFFVEHNRPATFKRPLMSLMGDWVMWWQTLMNRL